MQTAILSGRDVIVSKICLGTMGYGFQVSEEDAHEQMTYALDHGVTFWDTAEMYPVPPTPERYGHTESILGRWFQKTGRRKDVVLASKIAGPNRYIHIRGGTHQFSQQNIVSAVDESLARLQTDVIDLYQLHWPERTVPMFGQRNYVHDSDEQMTPLVETLRALATVIQSGKVRFIGLSNETPWGTMEFLRIARAEGLPIMVSVQNAYSLLNRHYELSMAEVSMREGIGLLAYSPLGYGVLGGRYCDGNIPKGSRADIHPAFALRYRTGLPLQIAQQYKTLAEKHGMTLPTMALAFVRAQPFVVSTIIGASSMDQLREDIASVDVTLSPDLMREINEIHEKYPNIVA